MSQYLQQVANALSLRMPEQVPTRWRRRVKESQADGSPVNRNHRFCTKPFGDAESGRRLDVDACIQSMTSSVVVLGASGSYVFPRETQTSVPPGARNTERFAFAKRSRNLAFSENARFLERQHAADGQKRRIDRKRSSDLVEHLEGRHVDISGVMHDDAFLLQDVTHTDRMVPFAPTPVIVLGGDGCDVDLTADNVVTDSDYLASRLSHVSASEGGDDNSLVIKTDRGGCMAEPCDLRFHKSSVARANFAATAMTRVLC